MAFPDNFDASRNMRYIEGRFFLNGASAIDNTQNKGAGALFTATRTGVGTATLKILIPAVDLVDFHATMSKAAVLARALHVLGWTKGTDGMWTVALALTDLNNAGVAAQEWAVANAAAFISFNAELQMGDGPV